MPSESDDQGQSDALLDSSASPRREPHRIALGLERIGLVSLRFPLVTMLVLVVLCCAAAFGIGRIKVDDSLS